MKAVDLSNKIFGKLKVVSFAGSKSDGKDSRRFWLCKCECGNQLEVVGAHLNNGSRVSCGCVIGDHKITHGMSKTREYRTWWDMWQRCTNENNLRYKDYGGRGIRVCDRWLEFDNFYADMGARPSAEYSLDRWPDNNGNYELSNCRWATRSQQQLNKR